MKLAGSYKLNVEKEKVWIALNNPEILKKCIPGCDSFEKLNDITFNASATNQIGPMNATFSGEVKLLNIKQNESYTLSGTGQSSVGFVNGSAEVKLIEVDKVTTLNYEVNVNVGGKIAQLGSRLIDGVAKKMADYFFGRFADEVAPLTVTENIKNNINNLEKKNTRIKELKSNFLNKYIYSILAIFILLIVAIIYFVSR